MQDAPAAALTHLNVLAFESKRWNRPGAKEAAIAGTFGVTSVAYYVLLRQVVLAPSTEAAERFPAVIRRVRDGMDRQERLRGRAS